jgi:serine/threonine-protein kinase
MHKHLKEPLTPPDHLNTRLTAGCAAAIEMMMAKDRERRYPSVNEAIEDLDLLLRGEPPHYAQQGMDHDAFTNLAKGQAQERAPYVSEAAGRGSPAISVALGVGLAVSLLFNIILIVLRS